MGFEERLLIPERSPFSQESASFASSGRGDQVCRAEDQSDSQIIIRMRREYRGALDSVAARAANRRHFPRSGERLRLLGPGPGRRAGVSEGLSPCSKKV